MPMKSKKKKKSGIPRFYIIYLCSLAVAVIVIIAALGIVSSRLTEYEAAQPKYVADSVFTQYFSPLDLNALLAVAEYDAGDATASEITEYLTAEIGDETVTYSTGSSQTEDEIKYIVKAGNKKFAAINLRLSDKTTAHGYKTYEFDKIELYLSVSDEPVIPDDPVLTHTVTIKVPSGYKVTVDGAVLPATYITGTYQRADAVKFLPSGTSGIPYEIYTQKDLTELPDTVAVTDAGGVPAELIYDEETLTYTAGVIYSDTLMSAYGDYVTEAVTYYAAYMQADKKFKDIKEYFDPECDLYDYVEAAGRDAWMVFKHSGYDFADIEIGEFYDFGGGVFSCHISFTHILHRENSEDRPDVIDMYVFLHNTSGADSDAVYKIFEWYNND